MPLYFPNSNFADSRFPKILLKWWLGDCGRMTSITIPSPTPLLSTDQPLWQTKALCFTSFYILCPISWTKKPRWCVKLLTNTSQTTGSRQFVLTFFSKISHNIVELFRWFLTIWAFLWTFVRFGNLTKLQRKPSPTLSASPMFKRFWSDTRNKFHSSMQRLTSIWLRSWRFSQCL